MEAESEGFGEIEKDAIFEMHQRRLYYLNDITAFCKDVLHLDVAPCHAEWLTIALGNKRSIILAPRDHGKSTMLSLAMPLWLIARDPNKLIINASNSQGQAEKFIRLITAHIERNETFREVFGNLKPQEPEKWTDKEIVVKRSIMSKDATLTAISTGSAALSFRADHIIADDVLDMDNVLTEGQRQKSKDWFFNILTNMLEPGGSLTAVGTAWHPEDLYQDLLHNPEYKAGAKVYTAVQDWNKQEVLWPAKWPWEALMQRRAEIGSIAFERNFQNNPEVMLGHVFRLEWLQFYDPEKLPADLSVYMGVDPAISTAPGADYFAIAVIGVDSNKQVYVLDIYRAKLEFPEQPKAIITKAGIWKPLKIGIESNAYQKALAQHLKTTTMLPIFQVKTNAPKEVRMAALSPHFENGRIRLRQDMHDFIQEYLAFPYGKNDDQLDALDIGMQCILQAQPRVRIRTVKI
jgi:predicted phage terminase large subunit-like protein